MHKEAIFVASTALYSNVQGACYVITDFKSKTGPHTLCLIKLVRRIRIVFAVMFSRRLSFLAEARWHEENAPLKALLRHWSGLEQLRERKNERVRGRTTS